MRMYSINVLIITYNQQDVISRAIDSVLCQKDFGLNKIIICDDCSTDNNQAVIRKYVEKYPQIIEFHPNDVNLGIYGNINNITQLKGKADLYTYLSGDDAFCDGYFKTIQDFLIQKSISIEDKAIAFYADWKVVNPNGSEKIFKNDKVEDKTHKLIDYRLRGLIYERSVFMTQKLLNSFKPVDVSHGVPYAEMMHDNQTSKYVEETFYVPFVASIYYSGVGFSTKTHNKKYWEQYLFAHEALLESQDWTNENQKYIKSIIAKDRAKIDHSLWCLIKYVYFYLQSNSFGMGCSVRNFYRNVTAIFVKNVIMRKY